MNKQALIRYKTIDQCLQNRARKWTLEDLMEAVSEALTEYEGQGSGVSRRTIQSDIQTMRSEKLGYEAPIEVVDKKYYTYSRKGYSITNIPLQKKDLETLSEAMMLLNQFRGFTYFNELSDIVTKLEARIAQLDQKTKTYIHLESNDRLRGLTYLDRLLKEIKDEQVLDITYKSFKAAEEYVFTVHPYLLKEFRNRWFLLCSNEKDNLYQILALDRMIHFQPNYSIRFKKPTIEPTDYFKDMIGVSRSVEQKKEKVRFFIRKADKPYLTTKPLHSSQRVIEEREDGAVFELDIIINFELKRDLIAHEAIVLAPEHLKKSVKNHIKDLYEQYNTLDEQDAYDNSNP